MNRTMTVQTFWRDRVRQEWKIAFFSVMIIGLIAHTYKFTNTLLNHDSLYNGHNSQNMVTLGRWFLSVACGTGGYFDLPWMNGILSLFWIGLTAAVIVDIFEIRDPVVIVLAGGMLVSFPCITNTFFYEYTADGYMLAMLLSALTLWLSRMRDEKKSHILLAALCICFSCGTYQAYVSFALMLSICYLLWQFLTAEPTNHEAWRWVKKQIVIYCSGMLLYLLLWKLCQKLEHIGSSGYQGIDEVGALSTVSLVSGIQETLHVLAQFLLGGNIFERGLTGYAIFNLAVLALLLVAFLVSAKKNQLYHKPLQLVLTTACVILMPFVICIWRFLSPDVVYHTLMLQSICVLYLFALFLSARFIHGKNHLMLMAFFAVMVFRFCVQANASYYKMDQCMEHSRATAIEMLSRIHQTEGSEQATQIAFLGGGDQSLVSVRDGEILEMIVNAHQIHTTLIFDNFYAPQYLHRVMGTDWKGVTDEQLAEYMTLYAGGMDTWPGKNSIKVVDDTIIILLPDMKD